MLGTRLVTFVLTEMATLPRALHHTSRSAGSYKHLDRPRRRQYRMPTAVTPTHPPLQRRLLHLCLCRGPKGIIVKSKGMIVEVSMLYSTGEGINVNAMEAEV